MLHKIDRVSIFDDCDYMRESSVMDSLTQSAGAAISPKNIKMIKSKLGEPDFFGKNKKKAPRDTTWKYSTLNWLVDNGNLMLNMSMVKKCINNILAGMDLGTEYIKDGDRVSNYYKYDSHQVIYNDTSRQNYYFVYTSTKDKKLPILVFKWMCAYDPEFPIYAFTVWGVDKESKLPALMDFLLQNERNGSAYK